MWFRKISFKINEMFVFFLSAVIVNVILLISVVDIHFRISDDPPLIKNQCLLHTNTSKTSKRLVFFLSDGLRADAFYDVVADLPNSFLREKMKNGTWGVSTVAPPTLTKQAVLSIFSGKPFSSSEMIDKLINIFSFNIQKPQIADNLLRYAKNVFFIGNIVVARYFGNYSDSWIKHTYATHDATRCWENYSCYDEWSFKRLDKFLDNNQVVEDLVIFVYLYGQDYCGHNRGPRSKFCLDEIKIIDKRIGELFEKIEEIFNDKSTTYLFTSDHGMTDNGVHSWISKEETETPFVIWGNGVAKSGKISDSPKSWKVKHLTRFDINQIDMAPLLSILLGKPIPKESIGVFHPEILSFDEQVKAKGMFCNVEGLKHLIEATIDKYYKSDSELHLKMTNNTGIIEKSMQSGNFSLAISSSKTLVKEYLDLYINLTHDLYKNFLIIVVASAYVGWGLYLFSKFFLMHINKPFQPRANASIYIIFAVLALAITIIVIFSHLPFHFLMYFYLSIGCWFCFIKSCIDIILNWENLKNSVSFESRITTFLTFLISWLIILCINDSKWAAVMLIFATLSFWATKLTQKITHKLYWSSITSALIIMFIIQSPIIDSNPNIYYAIASGISWILLILGYISLIFSNNKDDYILRDFIWSVVSLFSIALAIIIMTLIAYNYKSSLHLEISWILLTISILYPIFSGQENTRRLFHLVFALGIPFILMSVRHEAFGLLMYAIHVISWINLEMRSKSTDAFRAFYFLFYVWIGFFVIGNKNKVTSYDISWTRCFLHEVGDRMILLILYKQIIPTIILNACVITMYKKFKTSLFRMMVWYLFLNNCIGFYFFFGVKGKNENTSGNSFMNHILSQIFPISVIVLMLVSKVLTSVQLPLYRYF